ncbi:uncharacterized protein LOC129759485 [Uranotaenia lowii]|uniref:uncharacterized protein LOC129759485 n=1 Tax=Uranotaenia lowii TaxID=190385 RepID=UPI00247A0149|nr:uncharacterized protein LOC129759485 [Uranotaenia lowii]
MDSVERKKILSRGWISGHEMLEHHAANHDLLTQPKRFVNTAEEAVSLGSISELKDSFRRILAQQRINREAGCSEGEWEPEQQRVRIVKAVGKWNVYGYGQDGQHYLDGYEALHLMEMNRLIVYWNSVPFSIEQAYLLFLGHATTLSLEEYQVYSRLMRCGYYLLKYDPTRKYRSVPVPEIKMDDEEKCIWKNLFELLRQPHPLNTDKSIDESTFCSIRQSMTHHSERIKSQVKIADEIEGSSNTENDAEPSPKRLRFEEIQPSRITKLDRMIQLFEKIDVIKSNLRLEPSDNLANDGQSPKLTFDVYSTEGAVFRKSEPPIPEYRIIVRSFHEPLLLAKDISRLYQSQVKPAVPILMMQVSETLSVHCFLYQYHLLPKILIKVSEDSHPIVSNENNDSECDSE